MTTSWLLWALATNAYAGVSGGGDVKTFFSGTLPYEHLLMPEDPAGQGAATFRAKGRADGGDWLRIDAHLLLSAQAPAAGTGGLELGGDSNPDQLVDMTRSVGDDAGAGMIAVARVDRLAARITVPHADITLGRQPITFGRAAVFTPLDLVAPFHPAVVDQEYKPGVDAARLDAYAGTSAQFSLVGAWAGHADLNGLILASHSQVTVGVWDVGLFAGSVRGDLVGGISTSGSAGPVGIVVEGTWTAPPKEEDDPFLRATAGAMWRPTGTTTLTGEVYVQTIGATDPGDYLRQATDDRYSTGELWAMGRTYAALNVSQEVTPTVFASATGIANLEDASAMVGPTLSWSVSEEASVDAGAWFGVGERPGEPSQDALMAAAMHGEDALLDAIPVNSEFGLLPTTLFLQMRAYF